MVPEAQARLQSEQAKCPILKGRLRRTHSTFSGYRAQGPFRRGYNATGRQPEGRLTLTLQGDVYLVEAPGSC